VEGPTSTSKGATQKLDRFHFMRCAPFTRKSDLALPPSRVGQLSHGPVGNSAGPQNPKWLRNKVNPENVRHRVVFMVAGARSGPATADLRSPREKDLGSQIGFGGVGNPSYQPCTPLISTYRRTYGSTYAVAYLPLHTPASL
jgi:hypothetical protein